MTGIGYFWLNISFIAFTSLLVTCTTTYVQQNISGSTPNCQLQLECIGASSSGFGRVRIPVRSARGPPGPAGQQGKTGPPGPRGETSKSSHFRLVRT
ncbi:unnamed protein product [Trichobilharzia regenti]|nr:unnamed protein product [Trichobilharzia regenti]